MPKIEEIEETKIRNFENEKLTYEIFIDKGINIINKIYILIQQYNKMKDNTEILIDKIKKNIKIINMEKENYKKLNIDLNFNYIEIDKNKDIITLIKNIKDRLCILDLLLNNYVENFKNYISCKYLQIKELYKNNKYYNEEFCINYENEVKEIDKLIFNYREFNTDNQSDDLFGHIINISNVYILITKNILNMNIITKIGEILKKQNTVLKIIYKDLY